MGFELVAPASVEEAIAILGTSRPGAAAALAGGTDLLLDIDDGRAQPERVVSLRRLPWRSMHWTGRSLTIGSTLPLRAVELDATVRDRLPGLWQAIRAVGGVALRHRATLGGNLARASPASDLLPILLAYDAVVELVGAGGRRSLPLDRFLLGSRRTALRADELIESATIPFAAPSEYVWQRVRPANDISQVGVAVVRAPEAPYWRVALGGVQPNVTRLPTVEKILASARPTDAAIDRAAVEAAQRAPFVTDKRATESYRRRLVHTLVRRAVRATAERSRTGGPP
ncbi:MAG TPA: FAD binding domain-containing protein [Thermoplasmata archaeon]